MVTWAQDLGKKMAMTGQHSLEIPTLNCYQSVCPQSVPQGDEQKVKENKLLLSRNISGCLLENPSFPPLSIGNLKFSFGLSVSTTQQGSSGTTSLHSTAAGARLAAGFSQLP